VRHLLDMRSGVAFSEDYTDPRSDVRELDAWVGWRAGRGDQEHRGLYAYLVRLGADRPHGGSFLYRSCDTDALGWVIERATGERMADLLGELIWQPLGAEHDADLLCDGLGAAIHDGGLNATARDMARFGQLLLDGGRSPARVVLPPEWLAGAWAVDADARGAFAASPAEVSFPGGWYRNSFWFRPGDYGDVLLCLGIHGQMVHVSRRTRTVCVKFSSWPQPQHPELLQDTLRAFDAVGGALAGRDPVQGRRGLPGVVAGLSRSGGLADRPGLKGGS
jgi:CubicO group peptidase (beta-lactamase class C family)